MWTFTLKDRKSLIELLKTRGIMSEDHADHFTHALLDIRESAGLRPEVRGLTFRCS